MTTALTAKTNKIPNTRTASILQRVDKRNETAIEDCVHAYGSFVCALAKRFTRSPEEAAAAAQEIFIDIWRYSERANKTPSAEEKLIVLIALRRLIRQLR